MTFVNSRRKWKTLLALLLAVVLTLQLAMPAFAEESTVSVLDGLLTITDEEGTAVSTQDDVVTITVTGFSSSAWDNPITLISNADYKAELKFDYTIVNASAYSGFDGSSGTYTATIEAGAEIKFNFTAPAATTATLTMSNFSLTAVSDSANVMVIYDSTLGSVTVDNETVANGGVIEGVGTGGVTLTAVPNTGATFVGWVDENGTSLATETTYTHYPTGDITLTAVFATAAAAPWFKVGDYTTQDLADAINKAKSGTNKTIVLTGDGTLPANTTYTIPSGVKLLIPYKAYGNGYTGNFDEKPDHTDTAAPGSSQSAYVTLTLGAGTVLNCEGQICVDSQVYGKNGTYTGVPTGLYGHIQLSEYSQLIVDGGTLYCYGYITGDGDVIANSGTVYEVFQLLGWKGGSATVAWYKNGTVESFPFNDYAVQNIEADFTVNAGAAAKGVATVTVSTATKQIPMDYIGSGAGLVQLGAGASVCRSFTPAENRMCYTLHGNATVGSVNIEIKFDAGEKIILALAGMSTDDIVMNSANHILAIPYYMDFVAAAGSTVTLANSYKLLPGATLTVENGTADKEAAKVIVSGNLYIYDTDDYVGKSYGTMGNSTPVLYVASTGATSGLPAMDKSTPSGQVIVNGTLEINGAVYITENSSTSKSADKVLKGTGTVINNSSATEAVDDVLDEFKYSNSAIVDCDIRVIPVVGKLAGVSDDTNYQSFEQGTYHGLGDGWWYQHKISLTGIDTPVTVVPVGGYGIEVGSTETVIDHVLSGGSVSFQIFGMPEGYQLYNGDTLVACTGGVYTFENITKELALTLVQRGHTCTAKDDTVYTVEATCLHEGYSYQICADGCVMNTQVIAALGHDEVAAAYEAPGCTTVGHKAGTVCARCSVVLSGREEIPETGHRYLAEGSSASCSVCGNTAVEMVHGNKCVAGFDQANRASTLYNIYVEEGTTITLKDTETFKWACYKTTAATGATSSGNYGSNVWHADTITVTADGWIALALIYVEENGNYDEEQSFDLSLPLSTYVTIDAPEHVHSYKAVVTAATCLEKGYTTYTCPCGDSYTGEEVTGAHQYYGLTCCFCGSGMDMVPNNRFASQPSYEQTRISAQYNIYLLKGVEISLKDATNFRWAAAIQSNSESSASAGYFTSGWSQATVTVPSAGWVGITIMKADGTAFTDSERDLHLSDYITLENVPELIHGNKFASSTAATRVSTGVNLYLKAGTILTLNDADTFDWCCYKTSDGASTSTSLGTIGDGGWVATTPLTVEADGWVGITIRYAADDGTTFDLSQPLSYYVTIEEPPCEHSYKSVVTAPTCTAGGYTTYTCSECGDTYTADEVPALGDGHTEAVLAGVAATCTEPGLTEGKKCSVCGEILVAQEEIPAVGYHTYHAMTCSVCGDTNVELIHGNKFSTGHSQASRASTKYNLYLTAGTVITLKDNDTYNWVCYKASDVTDDTSDEGDYDGGAWHKKKTIEVTADGWVALMFVYVDATGKIDESQSFDLSLPLSHYVTIEEPQPHTHSYESVVTAPTCTEKGYTTYTCSCGATYTGDEKPALGGSHQEAITSSGRAATCTIPGLTEGKKCSVCDAVLAEMAYVAATGHSYDAKGVCSVCDHVKEDQWSGRSAVFVGDSITAGSGTDKIYYQYLTEALGLGSVTGMGISGSCISNGSDYGDSNTPLINRYETIPSADLIQIFMGTNDYGHTTPIGTPEDTQAGTFYGALNTIIPYLLETHKDSKIVFVTPLHRYVKSSGNTSQNDSDPNVSGHTLADYVEAIKLVCAMNGVSVIDLYTECTLDPKDTTYFPDKLHPNAAGHEVIAGIMESHILDYAPATPAPEEPEVETDWIYGNKFVSGWTEATNRISTRYNLYLPAETTLTLNDTDAFDWACYKTSGETSTSDGGNIGAGSWEAAKTVTVEADGWVGIAIRYADNRNFETSELSKPLSDYVTIEGPELICDNKFAPTNKLTRISTRHNLYLPAGTVLTLKDNVTFQWACAMTSSETSTDRLDGYFTGSGWCTAVTATVPEDGWVGITFKYTDDRNFELSELLKSLSDYVTIVKPHIHTYGEPGFNWTTTVESVTCTATFTCTVCAEGTEGHELTVSCVVAEQSHTNATCGVAGSVVYTATATVEFGDKNYTADSAPVVIPALEHSYTNYTSIGGDLERASCDHGCGSTHTKVAASNNDAQVEVVPETGNATDTSANVTIGTGLLGDIAKNSLELHLNSSILELVFDNVALNDILTDHNGKSNVSIVVQNTTPTDTTGKLVFDIYLEADGEAVAHSDFGTGTVTVTIPLASLNLTDEQTVEVYYVAEGEEDQLMDSEIVDGNVVFQTNHFSEYEVRVVDAEVEDDTTTGTTVSFVNYTVNGTTLATIFVGGTTVSTTTQGTGVSATLGTDRAFVVESTQSVVVAYTTDGTNYTPIAVSDVANTYVMPTDVTGDIQIAVAFLGDANLNGKVNTKDAQAVHSAALSGTTLEGLKFLTADVTSNNKVNTKDAQKIHQYALGSISSWD